MDELKNMTLAYTSPPGNGTNDNTSEQGGDLWKMIARSFYIIVFLLGIAGNLLTFYIILSRKFMRRVIHIYTLNLALSDLIVILLYIPVEIVRNENDLKWTMGASMCKLNNFVTPTSLIASIFTLLAITLDRHRGVTRPFQWRGDSKKLLKWTMPAIWLMAIICSSPLFYFADILKYGSFYYCIETWPNRTQMKVYWIIMFLIMVVIPLSIIIVANARMIYFMKKVNGTFKHPDHSEQQKQHRRMIRMVVALVLVYAICSSPQHIVFFWFAYGDLEKRVALSKHVFKAANLMVIVQSAINPVIYGLGRKDFKGAVKNIFQCVRLRLWYSESQPLNTSESNEQSMINNSKFNPAPLFVNKKLEILRKKSEARSMTDTPQIDRKELGRRKISLPTKKSQTDDGFSRQKHLSLQISLSSAKKPSFGIMKKSSPKLDEEQLLSNGSPRYSKFVLDVDELSRLADSPETFL